MTRTSGPDLSSMVLVPGGSFSMGSERFYPEEAPVRAAEVGDVWFDVHPVTNAHFALFVEATSHVTAAEVAPTLEEFPGADPEVLVPGSQVFTESARPVPLDDWTRWWRWQPGADWRHPQGPGSDLDGLEHHPVVHVGWQDALAYARWVGKSLPTEADWEHAARGGLVGSEYAWGDVLAPEGRLMANTWQGGFPFESADPHGHHRTSPVGFYPPNGYGLLDMIGNVWEWTATPWSPSPGVGSGATSTPLAVGSAPACCGGSLRVPAGSGAGSPAPGSAATATGAGADRMVSKGGSHLCSPHYCQRYRPAARQGPGVRDAASHLGFRCVVPV